MFGNVLQLLVDDGVQLLIAAGVGVVRDAQRGVGLLVAVQVEVDADTVGAALLFAYGVGIGYGETALEEVELKVALGREGNVGRIVYADIGQWGGLLFAEDVGRLAACDAWHTTPVGLLMLVGRGQRSQILTEQRAQLVERHVSDDDSAEVGCVAETLLVYLEDAVVVGLVDDLLCDGCHARVVTVEYGAYGVVIVYARRGVAVAEERTRAVDQAAEGCGVAPRLGEVEVGQLEERLEFLDRAAATDALSARAHRGTDQYGLAGQHLAQGGLVKLAHAGLGDAARDEREVGNVAIIIDRRAAVGVHQELHLVGGEVGASYVDFHAIRQGDLGEAVLVGLLADDAARFGQLADELLGQLFFTVGVILLLLGRQDGLLELGFGGQHDAFLVGGVEHTDLIAVADEFTCCTVHLVEGYLTVQTLCQLQVELLRGQRLGGQEVAHALVDEVAVAALVTLLIAALSGSDEDALGAVQL